MRRCLHSLLVGVLTFSLSIDAARACGHLRHWRRCQPACGMPVVVVDTVAWDACCGAGPVCSADVAWTCGGTVAEVVSAGCEEIACGAPLECCGAVAADVTAPAESVAVAAAGESVIAPPPVVPTPAPVPPAPVASDVPKLEPVAPVTALEPAAEPVAAPPTEPALTMPAPEPAPAPAEPPTALEPPAPEPELRPEPHQEPEPAPKPRNIFEEIDATAAVEPDAIPAPAAEETPVADAPVDLGDTEPAALPVTDAADAMDATESASDVVEPADQPAVDEPVMDEPTADDAEPAAEPGFEPALDSEPAASAEPLRRWIDDTASYAVVGRLIDVRGDTVEIAKADGRSVTVPLARLSGFDRDYVAEAGARVAAARQRGPHPRETASR